MWGTTTHRFPHGNHATPIKVAEVCQALADGATASAIASPPVQVKAAGSVRTIDAPIAVMNLGVTRIGATATEAIILDFQARRYGDGPAHHAPVDAGRY